MRLRILCAVVLLALTAGSVSAQQRNATPPKQPAPAAAPAPAASSPSSTSLPVKRVVLYKSGVGYFEHLGRVRGDEQVHIDFTSAQLDDALASLTVLDLGGGKIADVNFNSTASLEHQFSLLHLPIAEKTTLPEFLDAVRGARVQVRNGATSFEGRLLSVDAQTRQLPNDASEEQDFLSVVTDSGEVRQAELTPATSVTLMEGDLRQDVGRYLSLLASARQQDLRRMTISDSGSGERELFVSYISEVPIWKTTYRLVLSGSASRKPILQGWAIVDNTVGEDWDNVELSLVAGAPHSFIQPLSQPLYGRRPVVPLSQNAEPTPQTHESAMSIGSGVLTGVVTDQSGAVIAGATVRAIGDSGQVLGATTDNNGVYSFASVPPGNYAIEIVRPGFSTFRTASMNISGVGQQRLDATMSVGTASESVMVSAPRPGLSEETPEVSSNGRNLGSGGEVGSGAGLGRSGSGAGEGGGTGGGVFSAGGNGIAGALAGGAPAAQGQELGDLFEYKLTQPVTLKKNESALVPILQANVIAEKVSLWNTSLGSPRPLRAVWLTNSSDDTLDGGNFTVLEDDTFAGEGLLDSMKPGERRLLSYATDLGVRVDSKLLSQPQQFNHVLIARGIMTQRREALQEITYTVRNDDTSARILILEHPMRTGWKLTDDTPKPDESSSNAYRFRLNVEPKQTTTLLVREVAPENTTIEISNITRDQVALFLQQKSINPQVVQALAPILDQKDRIASLDAEIDKRDTERTGIFDDQQRLRENLKALRDTPEEKALAARYTQQLSDQETRLETLKKEESDLNDKKQQAQDQLDKMIEQLALDVTL
ncbi:MAG: carboxypeptidase regulatory-like domain-containing protein [Candidatus Acidiferrales bacterium]